MFNTVLTLADEALLKLYPHKSSPSVVSQIKEALDRWQVPLNPDSVKPMPFTNDFGTEMKGLLIPPEYHDGSINFIHTPRNLAAIADDLGIDIYHADSFYFTRDHFIRLADGTLATSKSSKKLADASERVHSANLYLHRSAATHSKNQLFNSWSGRTKFSDAEKELPDVFEKVQYLPLAYVEGGNMFTLTNSQGVRKICLGMDSFWLTLLIIQLEERSWPELSDSILAPEQGTLKSLRMGYFHTLSTEEVIENAEEMYASGLLLQNGKTGLFNPKVQLPLLMLKCLSPLPIPTGIEGQHWFRDLAVEASTIPKFDISVFEPSLLKLLVSDYMAKKKLVHILLARDLMIPEEDLLLLPQANYHLDTFLTPGPKNSIFFTNYALTEELLKALKSFDKIKPGSEDQVLLDRYIATAQKLDLELSPLLNAAALVLKNAGFNVIPAPNHIVFEPLDPRSEFPVPARSLSINFANALTGWSKKRENYYYITHGMQAGDELGNLIMDCFTEYLNRYIPGIEVYYIGKNEESHYGEAMEWWSRLNTQSGVHCVTLDY